MRKLLGVLFVLVSTLLGTVVLLGWGVRSSLLASEPWKSALQEARVYDRLLVEAVPEIATSALPADLLNDAPLAPADLVTIVQRTISASFLQQQVERGLDVAFDLLHGRTTLAQASLVIPLQDVKRQFPVAVQDRLVARLQALPVCTADQVQDFEKFKSLTDVLPPCRPKGLDAQAIVRSSLKVEQVAESIPATYDVIAEVQKQRGSAEQSMTVAERVAVVQDRARFAFQTHLGLTLAWVLCVFGSAALFLPHWRRVVQWFAISLFVPSALTVAGALVSRELLPEHFTVADRTAQALANIAQPVAAALTHLTVYRVLVLGGAGAAIAAVLFALAFALPRQRLKS